MVKRNIILFILILLLIYMISQPFGLAQADELITLNFNYTDIVIDPVKPILYATNKQQNRLYSINYETKEISYITFNLPPESLTLYNNEIYVSLLKGQHSYWDVNADHGAVAIVNANSFTKVDQFDVNLDPFDIIVDRNGIIYIISGSNQWTSIQSYSRITKTQISRATIRMQSYGQMHPTFDRIYTVNTDSSPRDYNAFDISLGSFNSGYDSPYHGDYPLAVNFKISPDGKYIFNGSGAVFSSNSNISEDMRYVAMLNHGFTDIAFDLEHQNFYTSLPGKMVAKYNYSNGKFDQVGTYFTQGEVEKLFYKNNDLLALIRKDGFIRIENINLNDVLSNEKDITSFSIAGVPGVISGNKIIVKVPIQVYLTEQVANFENSVLSTVKIGNVVQTSDQTKNNFWKQLTYTVYAQDGSTQDYVVNAYVERGEINYGDVNFDGAVTELDKGLAENYLKSNISLANIQLMAADVDGDGSVTSLDVQQILGYADGKITEFPIKRSITLPLKFSVTDEVLDSTKPIMYITSIEDKRVYSIDYEKREISFIGFELPPESLTFENNEIYVSLLKSQHSSYWWNEDQAGAIAIINADSFEEVDRFDINMDPWDILADWDGYIYVLSGSGQWTYLKSYSRTLKTEVASRTVYERSYGEMNPVFNLIHTIDTGLSPRDMSAFPISSGEFISPIWGNNYDSPYHGDYTLATNFKISPDGLFIFNGAGTIFFADMTYITKMDQGFSDIAFNLEDNEFYIINNNKIKAYDYDYLQQFNAHDVHGTLKKIFYHNGYLILLSQMYDSGYTLQTREKQYADTAPEDFNMDGIVDSSDIPKVAVSYGQVNTDYRFNKEMDLDNNRTIDLFDLSRIARIITR